MIVLLLPVLIIGLIVYNFFIQMLENEVTKSNLNLLSQVKENIDVKVTELNNITFHVSSNTNLTPYQATKTPFSEMETISQLKNYVSANNFISNLLLYFHGHDKLYSPYSTYDLKNFTEVINSFDDWKPMQFHRDLNAVQVRLQLS